MANSETSNTKFKSLSKIMEEINQSTFKVEGVKLVDSIFGYEKTLKNLEEINERANIYASSTNTTSKNVFNYNIANIVLVPVLTLIGLVGYFFKKDKIIFFPSVILFAFVCPALVVLGIELGYSIKMMDFCHDTVKFTTSDFTPIANESIGYYLACISKESQINISTARYELSVSFDAVYNKLNSIQAPLNDPLPTDARNNKLLIAYSQGKSDDVVNGINLLTKYNQIFQTFDDESTCKYRKDDLNYAEVNICWKNIDNLFSMIKYFFFAIIFLIPLSIGINRMIVLVNPELDKNNVSSKFNI